MIDCQEYRRLLLTDPGRPSGAMRAHVAACVECTQYSNGVSRFEARLVQALQINMRTAAGTPTALAAPARSRFEVRAFRRQRRRLATAAGVLLATFGVGFLWLAAPGRSLAAAVVNHMAGEPGAWARTAVAVPASTLDAVMSASGAHLKASAGLVTYVQSCDFRGHLVPHLVVQTAAGPVTVMLLVHESVPRGAHFDEQGYRGVIVRLPDHGSMALLEHSAGTERPSLDAVSAQLLGALDWTS